MKYYHVKFAWRSFWALAFFTIALLISFRLVCGVQDKADVAGACILMILGAASLSTDELKKLSNLMDDKSEEKRNKSIEKELGRITEVCPECNGEGHILWDSHDPEPQTCWKCSGCGKV